MYDALITPYPITERERGGVEGGSMILSFCRENQGKAGLPEQEITKTPIKNRENT
jgi:hypothetical protein